MRILNFSIKNVKGIKEHNFNFPLKPNKPIFFVAPNGFGKTSLSVAFDSLSHSKIDLHKKHLHKKRKENKPEIKIQYSIENQKNELIADETKNEIKDVFDVFVINSKLVSKAKVVNIQGTRIAQPSLEIEKTVLIKTVPEKVLFEYSYSDERKKFYDVRKIANDISDIFQNSRLLNEINSRIDFKKLEQVRKGEKLNHLREEINALTGTSEEIKSKIEDEIYSDIDIDEILLLCEILEEYDLKSIDSKTDALTSSLQIIRVYERLKLNFKKAVAYLDFLDEKQEYETIIGSINSTRYKIKPIVHKRSLIIEWPKATDISNGQRDVLTFITLLVKARKEFTKENCILIIDEIFDYLDDANLISFQYYISDFITKMSEERNLFPIILTHLDPKFFNHFCFSDKKIQVNYLKEVRTKNNQKILNILYKREENDLKPDLDKYFFHYHTDNSLDLTPAFKKHGLNKDWANSEFFHKKVDRELRRYLFEDVPYDPISVCISLRVNIEKLAHQELKNEETQEEFLKTKKTKNKLNYCLEKGRVLPETYFLLGIIYNNSLHPEQGQDITQALAIKMDNFIIKNMIKKIFETH